MLTRTQWISLASVIVAIAAIALALITHISGLNDKIISQKLKISESNNTISNLTLKLELSEKYNNLVEGMVSAGKIEIKDLGPYLPEEEIEKVAENITKSLNFPMIVESYFHTSGWMGDGKSGELFLKFRQFSDHIRITYYGGPDNWAGIYWQFPENNWGEQPGRNLTGATMISFIARGEKGNEVVEFKSGGIRGKSYADSFEKSIGWIKLSSDWKKYEIDLTGLDLSNVIGAFAFTVSEDRNKGSVTFYLKDIVIN